VFLIEEKSERSHARTKMGNGLVENMFRIKNENYSREKIGEW
jgi:hypothetical protein